jgi:heme-degrading monooxygenase HmoA
METHIVFIVDGVATTIPTGEVFLPLSEHLKKERRRSTMHARVVTIKCQPGKVDEATQILRESILPETRQQAGFQGVMALLDRSIDKSIAITLWQTEADAQASGASSSYLQAQLAKVASFFAAAPIVETYEVAVQE